MVKPNRDSAGSDVNSNPISRNERSGVVNLEAPTPNHFHSKRMKGTPSGEGVEKLLEIIRGHCRILAVAPGLSSISQPLARNVATVSELEREQHLESPPLAAHSSPFP
jgi:hypothetical protein